VSLSWMLHGIETWSVRKKKQENDLALSTSDMRTVSVKLIDGLLSTGLREAWTG